MRVAFAYTVVFQLVTIAAVVVIARRSPRELAALLRLGDYRWGRLWRPGVATVVAYVGVVAYSIAVEVFGIDFLRPESTVPSSVARDPAALLLAGLAAVVMAPFAEELMYRGLIMGGLLKWGFLPAAVISSLLFSAVHMDPGSLIPFFGVGMLLAWLFWTGGYLWDAIIFHLFFNLLSYLILVATGG